jgi:hypothetical protein
MSTLHPTIQYFAETVTGTFPLILVIGREPNTDRPIANTIGPFDMDEDEKARRCAFWNTSYGMLANIAKPSVNALVRTRVLKQECIERKLSPLIYADALPHGLLNKISNKKTIRRQLSQDEIAAHIKRIFSHRTLIDRVQLIIMSGLDDAPFTDAKTIIKQHAATEHLHVIEVPFFVGMNSTKIDAVLTTSDRETLKAIWDAFEAYNDGTK